MRLSTTHSLKPNEDAMLIHVVNTRVYLGCSVHQQPEDTIAMLEDEARKIGADAVVGISLVPMWDHNRNVTIMMGYGTVLTDEDAA